MKTSVLTKNYKISGFN